MLICAEFQPSSCLVIVTKITRRTRNKIKYHTGSQQDNIFRKVFNLVYRFKDDFETKSRTDFRNFEGDGGCGGKGKAIEFRQGLD